MKVISNIKLPKPKFNLHDKVCVYTRDGIKEDEVTEIAIVMNQHYTQVLYLVGNSYERYNEGQVFLKKDVKKKVDENLRQLKLFELPPNK